MSEIIENLKPKYHQLFETVLRDKVISTEISPRDGMFKLGQEAHYFEVGLSGLQAIMVSLNLAGRKPQNVQNVASARAAR